MTVYTINATTVLGEELYWSQGSWSAKSSDRSLFYHVPSRDMMLGAQAKLPYPDGVLTISNYGVGLALDVAKVAILTEYILDPKIDTIKAGPGREQQLLGWLLEQAAMLGDLNITIGHRMNNSRHLFILHGHRMHSTPTPVQGRVSFYVEPPSDGSLELIRAFQDLIHAITPPPGGGPAIKYLHKDFHFTAREFQVTRSPGPSILAIHEAYYIRGMAGDPVYWTGKDWRTNILEARLYHPGLVDRHTLIQKEVTESYKYIASPMSIQKLAYFMKYMNGNEPLPTTYYEAKMLSEKYNPKAELPTPSEDASL